MFTQLITPNPDIPCEAGMCLQYVRETFGTIPVKYGRAIDAWDGSGTQHANQDFPDNVWVPVYFTLAEVPAGHVALRAPDGCVYSTSDLGTVVHHHQTLNDLIAYYGYYGKPLTYLGWTEDVESVPVITQQETDMPIADDDIVRIAEGLLRYQVDKDGGGKAMLIEIIASYNAVMDGIVSKVNAHTDTLALPALTDAQVSAIALQLKNTLPAAVVQALAVKLGA